MTRTAPSKHSWIDSDVRNWRNNYDGDQNTMGCSAAPMSRLADSINRCLGRYPQPWAMMAWPITANAVVAAENTGSAPFVNFGHRDWVPNARSATVRVAHLERGVNSDHGNSFLTMGENAGANTGWETGWANNLVPKTCEGIGLDFFQLHRGDATNAWAAHGLNTYGGYTPLDICIQDYELHVLDANVAVHDSVEPKRATHNRDILDNLAESIRDTFHDLRRYNQGLQACWMGYGQANAWQYPQTTNAAAIVVTCNATGASGAVNLINSAWNVRNADSPGIDCKAYRCGRGHTGVASGTVIPCTIRVLAELNTAGPAENAHINVHGPVDNVSVEIPSNIGATTYLDWYEVNTGLNTMLDPTNVSNGVNKLDFFGSVANTGTDVLIVRSLLVISDYN